MATALESAQLYDIANQALEHWSLQVTSLTLASQSENTVFRVETADQGAFALRLHRPGYHSLPELESEQIWTRALADGGVVGDADVLRPEKESARISVCVLNNSRSLVKNEKRKK